MKVNKLYFYSTLLLMLILPLISIGLDYHYHPDTALMLFAGKWFVFWGIGLRLFTAGLKQTLQPAFTAKEIFHIENIESQVIVRELGFANICFGLAGIFSLFIPQWRTAAAFTGGLYMGIAGIVHIVKKPVGLNEIIAMVSDLFIFLLLAFYIYWSFENH